MLLRTFARGAGTIGLSMLGWAGTEAPTSAEEKDGVPTRVAISLRQPEVPKVGRNRFKVMVQDGFGQPLRDAEVSLTLYRRGLPGSKGYIEHPVQTKVKLAPGEEAGMYEAVGPIVAAGLWDVKMQVKPRAGKKVVTSTKIWADH